MGEWHSGRRVAPLLVVLGLLSVSRVFAAPEAPPKRIVSLAPGITETLFALGLGDRVVGVTPYCDYPAEARKIPDVGALYDPNYEAMLALRPDLVALLKSNYDARKQLENLGVATLMVDHQTIADIRHSILDIGKRCGALDAAQREVARIDKGLAALRGRPEPKRRPTVLLTIGRDFSGTRIEEVYIAGRKNYYDEVIELAGGRNVYEARKPQYPMLTSEALIRLNPEVIVELLGEDKNTPTPEAVRKQWQALPQIDAVRKGRIYTIRGYHALRPGPRVTQFAEELSDLLRGKAE